MELTIKLRFEINAIVYEMSRLFLFTETGHKVC